MATQKSDQTGLETIQKLQNHPPHINLGKVKKKHAKKLKKGTGVLMDDINSSYQQIKSGIDGNVTPVIISYEEKPRKKAKKKKNIRLMGLKVNRKKLKKRMKKSGIRHSFL